MKAGKKKEASEFLLRDLYDKSRVKSVQSFYDNAMNPCMDSTYKYVSH